MSLLNRPSDGIHSILIVIHNLLTQEGTLAIDEIIGLCAPEDTGDSTQVRQTLNTWVKLGLFDRSAEGKIAFHKTIPRKDRDREALPRVTRQLVLSDTNNANLWAAEGIGSADFTRSITWLLAQDVYDAKLVGWPMVQALVQKQFGKDTIFQNDTRWTGLKAWTPFFGFGWLGKHPSDVLIIDPTEAITDHLPDIFDNQSKLAANEFLTALAQCLPVLDGGAYRKEVEAKLREHTVWLPPPDNCLSTSLSRGILRLIHEGVLKGETLSDAGPRLCLTGRNRQEIRESYSHISFRPRQKGDQ
jgi:hypothetical protein